VLKIIRSILKRNTKITETVNTIGLALLAGFSAIELVFKRCKSVLRYFKIIALRNKIVTCVASVILLMILVIGGLAFANSDIEHDTPDDEFVEEVPEVLYIPKNTDLLEEIYRSYHLYAHYVDGYDAVSVEPPVSLWEELYEETVYEFTEEEESADYNDIEDDCDEEDTPLPCDYCDWVRVYIQQDFDRGSYQIRANVVGQVYSWVISDGWAIGEEFCCSSALRSFLRSTENTTNSNPSTAYDMISSNIYEEEEVWVPNVVTEDVFSHERCRNCDIVR